jgi:succinate-semialdehyde dehydrogenase/glutarate-semialdehyde dehydrogenase
MAAAAKTLTPLSLELGGKDPMIVLADADLERAPTEPRGRAIRTPGKLRRRRERIYVHESIYEPFVALLAAKDARHEARPGSRLRCRHGGHDDGGAACDGARQVDEAVKSGAKIVAQSHLTDEGAKGFFIRRPCRRTSTTRWSS